MIIRKSFTFENTHKVKNCSSERCKFSIHAHRYLIEVFLESDKLDNGMMVMDFGLTKRSIKEVLGIFDLSYSMWTKEDQKTKDLYKSLAKYYVETPLSPSAEAYSLMLMYIVDKVVKNTEFNNGEGNIRVSSVRVHETTTGWAESFVSDLENPNMPKFTLDQFIFSDSVKERFKDKNMWNNLINGVKFENPVVEQQVKV